MLINLSSDIPFVYDNVKFHFFDRKNLENQLPKYLYEIENLKDLHVITWPWNFSTTRIGTEVINILLFLWKIDKVYYLNKLEFFNFLWYDNIYLFSGNKNKFIKLLKNQKYEIINRKDTKTLYCEEVFEEKNKLDLKYIRYEDILKNYKKLDWHEEFKLLKAYYIFEPIVE